MICFLFGVLMNSAWSVASPELTMRVLVYNCVAVGDKCGLIEVVPDCTMLSEVQGGSLEGAMNKKSLHTWFTSNRDKDIHMDTIRSNFIESLAAACVFEHVLGLGDRHSGNLLLRRDGTIFHIDYGWIFGNDPLNWAVNEPFAITSAMVDFMEPKGHERFLKLAVRGFMELRKHHALLCGLALLVVPAQLNHVSRIEDVYYLREALDLESTDDEAEKRFLSLMNSSRQGFVQLNHGLHNLAVRKRGY